MSKTDPRIIKTLRHIDEALLECLKENEFRKITVDMLCRKALINRSTFYKYYADKYELLNNYLDRVLSEFSEAMATTDFILATPSTIANQQYIDNFRKASTMSMTTGRSTVSSGRLPSTVQSIRRWRISSAGTSSGRSAAILPRTSRSLRTTICMRNYLPPT